jgi:DNA-binding response OmpR family regulator
MSKILLVEDEQDLAMAIQFHLKQEGFHVTLAEDGLQAKQFLIQEKFDLILLDWMLPELSGIQLLRWLRTESDNKTAYVLMVSAKGELHNKIKGIKFGADEYLVKPFSLKDLTNRVHKVLLYRKAENQ